MATERDLASIQKTAARLKKLYTAAVYDIMDEMELPHQCLDLAIKPIERTMRIAGPAFTSGTHKLSAWRLQLHCRGSSELLSVHGSGSRPSTRQG